MEIDIGIKNKLSVFSVLFKNAMLRKQSSLVGVFYVERYKGLTNINIGAFETKEQAMSKLDDHLINKGYKLISL